jgi:hypothetical protein
MNQVWVYSRMRDAYRHRVAYKIAYAEPNVNTREVVGNGLYTTYRDQFDCFTLTERAFETIGETNERSGAHDVTKQEYLFPVHMQLLALETRFNGP